MMKQLKKIKKTTFLFFIILALFILAMLFYRKNIQGYKVKEGYKVISYANAPGNDIGLLDITDVSGTWLVNTGQEINGVTYSGKTCNDVCNSLSNCAGFLLDENDGKQGTCTFKTNVSTQQLNQNFSYYLNIK